MNIDESLKQYLEGGKFSNSAVFNFNQKQKRMTRLEALRSILLKAPNSSVVHLGCCDHMPLIEEKIKKGTYLHTILMKTAKNVMGIDINKEAVKYLTEKQKIPQIICADVVKDKEFITMKLQDFNGSKKWDYLLAGEMIEHVDNPVEFLTYLNDNYSDFINKIIITVPNAFAIKNMLQAFKGREIINSDHRYSFTPYTICKVLTCANIEIEEMYFSNFINQKKFRMLNPVLAKPIMCSSLIVIGKLGGGGEVNAEKISGIFYWTCNCIFIEFGVLSTNYKNYSSG